MQKPEITKLVKKILRHRRGIQENQIIHPTREWFIGLLMAVFLFAGFGYWNITSYIKYSNTSITGAVTLDNEVIVYRESLVQEALRRFSERQTQFDTLVEIGRENPLTDAPDVDDEPEPEEQVELVEEDDESDTIEAEPTEPDQNTEPLTDQSTTTAESES